MGWEPKDFCKGQYYGINNKDVPVCGRDNYQTPCIKEQCELYRFKHKGLQKFLQFELKKGKK